MRYIIKSDYNTFVVNASLSEAQDLALDLEARKIEREKDGVVWINRYRIPGNWEKVFRGVDISE